jgi:pimeloyl-ACP methyl ester carboxylesterase
MGWRRLVRRYGFTVAARACDDSRSVAPEIRGAHSDRTGYGDEMVTRTRWRAAAAVVTVGLIVAACGSSTEEPAATGGAVPAAPTTTDPRTFVSGDFYATPPAVAGQTHGDLVTFQLMPTAQFADTSLAGTQTYRILYRSSAASDDRPIVVSGLVIVPPGKPAGPRPMVAFAHGTVGSADACAPSKSYRGTAYTTEVAEVAVIEQWQFFIRQGFVVVATDYEGLGTEGPHPYLVGTSAGRSVLDSLVAARQLPAANASDTAVIYGHSQGGHAALFAGELAPTWAPDIKVAGVVAAAPFSEVDLLLPIAASTPGVGHYYVMGVYGQVAGNKKLVPSAVLDPVGLGRAGALETQCLGEFAAGSAAALTASGKTSFMSTNPLTLPEWSAQLASIVPGNRPTGAPIMVVQGKADATVPAFTTQSLVRRLCARNRVQYVEIDNAGHGDVLRSGDRDIRAFITNRLAGTPATSTC